jgi:prephenate dehydrogenase/chorismate mutase
MLSSNLKENRHGSRNTSRPKLHSQELARLRQEILSVTESIMKLMKKRQDLAIRVAEIKGSSYLPIENLEIEKRLKEKLSEFASEIGLDASLAMDMADVLLSHSKTAQRRKMFGDSIISFLRKNEIKTISIIGAGRMGGWFAGYFKTLGTKVILFDRKVSFAKSRAKELGCEFAKDLHTIAERSDLIFVAVPIGETNHEIARLQQILAANEEEGRCNSIIEVSSVKTGIMKTQSFKEPKVPVIPIHPLFGPTAPHFDPNTIVVAKSKELNKDDLDFSLVRHLFPQFKIFAIRAEAHDKQMALMLSLPHALALAFGDVIARNSNFIENKEALTPSYSTLKEFTSKVFSENPDVYYEIQTLNNFTLRALKELGISIDKLSRYVKDEKKPKFEKFFEITKRKLGDNA